MNRILAILSLVVAISVPVVCTAQQDQVFDKKKGTPTRGLISAVSPIQVKIEATGLTRAIDVKDILKVTFGDEPAELTTARERALAGQYGDAIDELKKIAISQISNDVIKQDVGYYAAYCMAKLALNEGGDKEAAKQQLLNFITQNTTTFHFFEGAELLGDLSTALGEYAEATKYYGGLSKAPWPEYQMRATVLQARSLSAEGEYAKALTGFEQVLARGLATPEANEQKMHATVGKAVCLAATGKHEEGIQIIEDLIAKNDPSDAALFGRAYNALGVCYMKTGETQDAILAFLHTDLLFFTDPETHAEALYHLSKLWADAGKSDRAVRARGMLTERYAGSRWAAMN
jgi:tetratricopeptide (TPR) repeat protein